MEKKIEEIKIEVKALQKSINEQMASARKVVSACNFINNSWSGSDLVGHADFFYGDFEVPPNNKRFSIEWGLINGLPDGWYERSDDEVVKEIENKLSISIEDLDKKADFITNEFEKLQKQAIIIFSGFSKDVAMEIERFSLQTKRDIFNQYWNKQIITRDRSALYAGRKIPTHKYYWATATFFTEAIDQLNEFLHLVDKIVAQNKTLGKKARNGDKGRTAYIDKNTFLRLNRIENRDFDLSKLISLCNELDDNYTLENYYSCAMLLRTILNHIPPIFGKKTFSDVRAQHGGKSFKDVMKPLDDTAKKIGDDYLHTQISKKVLAITKTQVGFQANLDVLLNEVAAILEDQ